MENCLTEDTRVAIKRIFDAQKNNQLAVKLAPIDDRKAKLKKLKAAIKAKENDIF